MAFSGQTYPDAVWNIPYAFGPDGFIEPGSILTSGVHISFLANFQIS